MTDSSAPLRPRGGGSEESYFRLRDEELINKMRAQMQRREVESALAERGGVDDPDLVAGLARVGITLETLPIVHLVPLFWVAWADGEMQTLERDLLRRTAAARSLDQGKAMELFNSLLKEPPGEELLAVSLNYIRHVLAVLPADQADRARGDLEELAWRVADSSGGFLRWIGRVELEEREALRELSARLVMNQPQSAAKLLEALGALPDQ